MKFAKICLVLAMALLVLAACAQRNRSNVSDSGTSPVTEDNNANASRAEDSQDRHIEDGDYDNNLVGGYRADDITENNDINSNLLNSGSQTLDNTDGPSHDSPEIESELGALYPAIPAMSTDFVEIATHDDKKLGWGSGGPTDDHGRPDGATLYQKKYGNYDAYFITSAGSNVYLTFDEGYENGFTPELLDTLKEKSVKAVFFITLDFAQRQEELVKRMIDEGHIIGNHSCKHLSFPDMTLEDAVDDIMKLHDYVKATFGYEMHLFRPPMGEFSEQTLALSQSLGYKSVFWSIAYKDYDVDNQPNTIEALHDLSNKTHPGAIFLLHAVSKTNAEILGDLIDNVREKGYQFARWDW